MGEEKMNNWLEQFGLERIHAHGSGHASGMDFNEIKPKALIPIHIEYPSLFKLFQGPKVKVPEISKEITE